MQLTGEAAKRIQNALSAARQWIDEKLAECAQRATAVSDLKFPNLPRYFPKVWLDAAKVVVVEQLPRPPLKQFGLADLPTVGGGAGITLKDTYFVLPIARMSERLHFHELVHVVQWRKLGLDRFPTAYAVGLKLFDYRNNPLEEMAYSLEDQFVGGKIGNNLIDSIYQRTDEIWKKVDLEMSI